MFGEVVTGRMKNTENGAVREEQGGLMEGSVIMDQIFTL